MLVADNDNESVISLYNFKVKKFDRQIGYLLFTQKIAFSCVN